MMCAFERHLRSIDMQFIRFVIITGLSARKIRGDEGL